MRNTVVAAWNEPTVTNYRLDPLDFIFDGVSSLGDTTFINPAEICYVPPEALAKFHNIVAGCYFDRIAYIYTGFYYVDSRRKINR